MDRMNALGLTEALRSKAGKLVPTFRNPKGGKIIRQLDHHYLSQNLWDTCKGPLQPRKVLFRRVADRQARSQGVQINAGLGGLLARRPTQSAIVAHL